MKDIRRYFDVINRSLFRTSGTLDYKRTTDAIIKLAHTIRDTDTDESLWYLGESGECTLDDLIVGAYWHYSEWHGGQWSQEYAALSALGQIFSPGMAYPEPDNAAYMALDAMASERQGQRAHA